MALPPTSGIPLLASAEIAYTWSSCTPPDPTQRWQLLGQNTFQFSKEFINVVTAHEVSHQWWGDTVGWASYHDRWLSEGLADFSAGLFLESTQPKGDDSQKFWDSERRLLLEKNEYGNRANDVGPLWMGQRLDSFKAQDADRRITYARAHSFCTCCGT
jgi:aminopeptidase N